MYITNSQNAVSGTMKPKYMHITNSQNSISGTSTNCNRYNPDKSDCGKWNISK